MKKTITYKNWEESTPKIKEGWQSWCQKSGNTVVAISGKNLLCAPNIGTMIEFLDEQGYFSMEKIEGDPPNYDPVWDLSSNDEWIEIGHKPELCDVLWEAVKKALE